MVQTSVYASVPRSNSVGKESLIYENIELALESLAGMDKHFVGMPDADGAIQVPLGLRVVRSNERIIALGRAAHAMLADFQKRTVIVGEAETGAETTELAADVGRFVWSCVNTSKVLALGTEAWRSIQIMPLTERHFYPLPPVRITPRSNGGLGKTVLVVDHDNDESRARRLVETLESNGFAVELTGPSRAGDGARQDGNCWSGEASFHVHVGHHTIAAEEMRVIDSWYSRRFVIQLIPRRSAHDVPPDALLVEHEANGFKVDTLEKVVAACREIGGDGVLQKKLLDAGSRTADPLARGWKTIAQDLVA